MTERDGDYERWQSALSSLQEVSGQYQALLKTVQVGFSFLSDESATTARRLTRMEAKIDAMDATIQQLLPHLAAIAAYVVSQQKAQRPPQERKSPPRRVNGE